jgi:hypothetical protein
MARLVRHPGQCTSSHGVPAVMAHRIVGDHSGDRSAFHRSTTLRAALRAVWSAAWAASSAARFRIKSAAPSFAMSRTLHIRQHCDDAEEPPELRLNPGSFLCH